MKTTYKNFCGICLSILAFSALPLQQANAQSCATPPSCETLGYTKSVADCSGLDALFCPFDMSKVFCITVKETEQVIPCEVGSILYSDKKCYNNASEDRIPIAVVFDAAGRLAVALESQGDLSWGGAWKDIPSLANCTLANYTTCGNNGKYNTTTILAYGKSQNLSYPAAEACNKYKTIGTSTGE